MQLSERIGRRMKLRLHVLMTVVQAGSMGKAAQHLPTPVNLLYRDRSRTWSTRARRAPARPRPSGIEPTPYSRALSWTAERPCSSTWRRGVKDIEFLANPTAGEVESDAIRFSPQASSQP